MPDKRTHAGQLNVMSGRTENATETALIEAEKMEQRTTEAGKSRAYPLTPDDKERRRLILQTAVGLMSIPGHRYQDDFGAIEIAATMLKNAERLAVIDGCRSIEPLPPQLPAYRK